VLHQSAAIVQRVLCPKGRARRLSRTAIYHVVPPMGLMRKGGKYKGELRRIHLPRTSVNKPPVESLIRYFIRDSSPCVPLVGVSSTPLDNTKLQANCHERRQRKRIVVVLLAQSTVVVLLMASGWWGMMTLGSLSLQAMRYPLYVAGCPLDDTTLQKLSAGGGCSQEGATHPIISRQPGAGRSENAHGAERHSDYRVPPRTSENIPSTHFGE